MRAKPKEKYGKFVRAVSIDGKEFQIREHRKLKPQIQKGRKPLIVGSDFALCKTNRTTIKGGFKNVKEVLTYLIEEVVGVKEYNLELKGNL